MPTNTTTTKQTALAAFLYCDPDEIIEDKLGNFNHRRRKYLVLTDEEANAKTADYIRESVWTCSPHFLARYCQIGIGKEDIEVLLDQANHSDKVESVNDELTDLVEAGAGMSKLIQDSISADGRAFYLSDYNVEDASPCGKYYIYRIN